MVLPVRTAERAIGSERNRSTSHLQMLGQADVGAHRPEGHGRDRDPAIRKLT